MHFNIQGNVIVENNNTIFKLNINYYLFYRDFKKKKPLKLSKIKSLYLSFQAWTLLQSIWFLVQYFYFQGKKRWGVGLSPSC